MNCSYFKRELETSHAPALLSDKSRAHAACCQACATIWQEQLSLNQLLRELEPIDLPDDFDLRLHECIRAGKSSSVFNPFFLPSLLTFARIASSSAVLILIAAVLYAALNGSFERKTADQIAVVSSEITEQDASVVYKLITLSDDLIATDKKFNEHQPKEAHNKLRGATSIPRNRIISTRRPRSANEGLTDLITLSSTTYASQAKSTLKSSPQPMQVTLRDAHGEREAFLLNAVSFGGQPLVQAAKLTITGADGQQGVW